MTYKLIKSIIHLCLFSAVCRAQEKSERRLYIDSLCQAAEMAHDTDLLAECYYMEGKFFEHNEPIRAVEWFHKSLDLVEAKGPSKELARLYVFLGSMSKRIGLQEEEEMYNELAKKVIIAVDDSSLTKRYFTFFREAGNDEKVQADILAKEAAALRSSGKNKEAILVYEQLIEHYKIQDYGVMGHVSSYLALSQIYSTMGLVTKAKFNLENAKKVERSDLHDNHEVRKAYEVAEYLLDSALGNWKEALIHFKKLSNLEKDIFLSDRAAAISQLNIEYQTEKQKQLLEKKENELKILDQNARLRRSLLIGSLILLVIASIIALYLFQLQKRNKLLADRNRMLLREQNHRVKNNLQFISSMLRLQGREVDSEIAEQQLQNTRLRIESMALLQRRLYSNGNLTIVNLRDYSESILESVLESYDLEDVELDLRIEEVDLDVDRTLSYGLILTELAQNSCKYAFHDKPNPRIHLSASVTDERHLIINYKDNGIGGTRTKSGFGLQMIKYQVAQLKGILKEKDNFEIIVEFKI